MLTPELKAMLAEDGYWGVCEIAGQVCALKPQITTFALFVGLDEDGYERRYCYEHLHEAALALARWDGREHPGGPWIKCKGSCGDLLNPALGRF